MDEALHPERIPPIAAKIKILMMVNAKRPCLRALLGSALVDLKRLGPI
jgi:hypothetical protein